MKSIEHCACVPQLGWQVHIEIYGFSVVSDFMLNGLRLPQESHESTHSKVKLCSTCMVASL